MEFRQRVEQLIKEAIEGTDIFLVDYSISSSNVIQVWIDTMEGISIKQCVQVSRSIEHNLDREEEDFELQVSSPGLDMPLKLSQQYQKNIGRNLNVQLLDGTEIKGLLMNAKENTITIESSRKVKIEGKKKKQVMREKHSFELSEIAFAKVVISFK